MVNNYSSIVRIYISVIEIIIVCLTTIYYYKSQSV